MTDYSARRRRFWFGFLPAPCVRGTVSELSVEVDDGVAGGRKKFFACLASPDVRHGRPDINSETMLGVRGCQNQVVTAENCVFGFAELPGYELLELIY